MFRKSLLPAAGLVLVAGCGKKLPELPEAPDRLVIFSIDGTYLDKEPEERGPAPTEVLHGYPVLGKVEVTDPDQRRQVMDALKEGMRYTGRRARCFIPRHVVRIETAGKQTDLVICFECSWYKAADDSVSGLIGCEPQALLDKLLTDAGVPLAPK